MDKSINSISLMQKLKPFIKHICTQSEVGFQVESLLSFLFKTNDCGSL
jgi:hypothetical protein